MMPSGVMWAYFRFIFFVMADKAEALEGVLPPR